MPRSATVSNGRMGAALRGSWRCRRGVGLADVMAVGAILMLAAAIAFPNTYRSRELMRRAVCAANLKGIGIAGRAYAEAHDGQWMTPPFRVDRVYGTSDIDYVCDNAVPGQPSRGFDFGEVGWDRHRPSQSPTPQYPNAGSIAVSTTRSFWLLVSSGDVHKGQFICPSSGDTEDSTSDVSLYYDFTSYYHVSYGYQVPFGPPQTRPRQDADPRQVFAADKGPFYVSNLRTRLPLFENDLGEPLRADSLASQWKQYNSANHGGAANGEGQSCLYADASVEFVQKPLAGLDHDNIYTKFDGERWAEDDRAIIYGITPHGDFPHPYPGEDAFGPGLFSSTDSMIYP